MLAFLPAWLGVGVALSQWQARSEDGVTAGQPVKQPRSHAADRFGPARCARAWEGAGGSIVGMIRDV